MRVEYSERLLARLLSWAALYGIKIDVTSLYPGNDIVLILRDIARRDSANKPKIQKDYSIKKQALINLDNNTAIRLKKNPDNSQKVLMAVTKDGSEIARKTIQIDEYISLARFFNDDEQELTE